MAKKQPEGALPKEIEPAYRLWARGNYRGARKEARRILAKSEAETNPEARALAQRILTDTAPDPMAIRAGVGGVVFVGVILFLLFH
jgi:hypothetical protein